MYPVENTVSLESLVTQGMRTDSNRRAHEDERTPRSSDLGQFRYPSDLTDEVAARWLSLYITSENSAVLSGIFVIGSVVNPIIYVLIARYQRV
jgi:hypothetical protein